MNSWAIAIDLGPEVTSAAVSAGSHPEILVLPTVVCLAPDGLLLAGEEAGPAVRDPLQAFLYDRRVSLGDRKIETLDLVAALIDRLVREANGRFGGAPAAVVITYPENWAAADLKRLGEAVRRTGLPGATTLPRPMASAAYQPYPNDDPRAAYALGALRWLVTNHGESSAAPPKQHRVGLAIGALTLAALAAVGAGLWPRASRIDEQAAPILLAPQEQPLIPTEAPAPVVPSVAAPQPSVATTDRDLTDLVGNATGLNAGSCVKDSRLTAPGLIEVVKCITSFGRGIGFLRFASTADLTSAMAKLSVGIPATSSTASCDAGVPAVTTWQDSNGVEQGQLFCKVDEQGLFEIGWSYTNAAIAAFTTDPDPVAVGAWWKANAQFLR